MTEKQRQKAIRGLQKRIDKVVKTTSEKRYNLYFPKKKISKYE